MPRNFRIAIALVTAALLYPLATTAQQPSGARKQPSAEQKIAQAVSAAPAMIGRGAAVMDWPDREGGEMKMLRQGTNGWTCMPDHPSTTGTDPMCLDEVFLNWASAWQAKKAPDIQRIGIGYMVAGGAEGSNTDPYAAGPAADNEWGMDPPHLMIVVPDVTALQGMPLKRESGQPWVMFRGTPYAHIMIPVDKPDRAGKR